MQSGVKTQGMPVKLSTMWLFAVLNYIYCDVFTALGASPTSTSASTGSSPIAPGLLWLGAAVLMEIPILMVLLARYLSFKANRWTNMVAGLIMTVAEAASLFVGKPHAFYIFFATIEIACTLLIVWLAWKWKEPESVAGDDI